ncbi:MAG: hypothetical protein Q8N61_01695 [bacterium]|nr:hypothetical protein [bacterium]
MHTWIATVYTEGSSNRNQMVEVAASNLTTALKRVVEEAWPGYGPRRGSRAGLSEGGKVPSGGVALVIIIRRVAKEK